LYDNWKNSSFWIVRQQKLLELLKLLEHLNIFVNICTTCTNDCKLLSLNLLNYICVDNLSRRLVVNNIDWMSYKKLTVSSRQFKSFPMNFYYGFFLCVLCLTRAEQDELNVRRIMKEMEVIPDVIKEPPKELLKVCPNLLTTSLLNH